MRLLIITAALSALLALSGCGLGGMLWCATFTPHEDCAP
jgi:hypothetical protein